MAGTGAYQGADQVDLAGACLQWAERVRLAALMHPFPFLTHLSQDGLGGLGANSSGKVILLYFSPPLIQSPGDG